MGSEEVVFGKYTQSELDYEYDNVKKFSDFDFSAYLEKLSKKNKSALEKYHQVLHKNLQFGPSKDEVLDLFVVNPGGPTHVFFHGGYWRMLHKDDFTYIANGILPHGHNLAVINYSLIPEVRMGELVGQCCNAIHWLMNNAADYSLDPAQFSISGHSAGGHLAAMMCTYEFPYSLTTVCALSGIFDLKPIQKCFLNKVLDLTNQEVEEFSPVLRTPVHKGPLLLLTGEKEGPEYARQANDLAAAWSHHRDAPKVMFAEQHDHFTLRAELGEFDSEITQRTLFL